LIFFDLSNCTLTLTITCLYGSMVILINTFLFGFNVSLFGFYNNFCFLSHLKQHIFVNGPKRRCLINTPKNNEIEKKRGYTL